MKERPILFSGAMVRALLDGSKTQTRRVMKPQPTMYEPGQCIAVSDMTNDALVCPYGQPGDRLWVRETWVCDDYRLQQGPYVEVPGAREALFYRADNEQPFEAPEGKFWKPSIHMPRWASRILLEIVSVRVERLQDCSQTDAISEGALHIRNQAWDREHFPAWRYLFDEAVAAGKKPPIGPSAVQAYQALWQSINGPGSWDANPWVWVVEFKRVAL
jgi:hypothetical protein